MLSFAPVASVPISDDVIEGATIEIGSVAIVIAGVSPVVSTGIQITSPAANVNTVGAIPIISGGASVSVGSTDTAISTAEPIISIGDAISSPRADIATSAIAPVIVSGVSIAVSASDTSVSGQVPEYENALPVANVQLAPVSPSIFTGASVSPASASLALDAGIPFSISTGVRLDAPQQQSAIAAPLPKVSTGVLREVGIADIEFEAVDPQAVSVGATVNIVQPRAYVVGWRRPVILTGEFSERRIYFVTLRQII